MLVHSQSEAPDAYAAFDGAAERLESRLQRYKGRLIDRRKDRGAAEEPVETAQHYVLAADSAEGAEDAGRAAARRSSPSSPPRSPPSRSARR